MDRYLGLFNRLAFREKLFVVIGFVLAIYMVLDLALVTPQEKRRKALRAEISKVDLESQTIRAEMVAVKAQLDKDPHAKDRAQLDAFKKAIEEADAFLAKVESDPKQVGHLLRQILAGSPGLTLASLKTLPGAPIVDASKGGGKGTGRLLYRRGIELVVRGNYLAMLPFLQRLQDQPTRLLWGEAEISVGLYPDATLRITFFTVTNQPAAPLG
jgi:MSHA biogenesis protein MshJ